MANQELLVRIRDLHEELAGINDDLNLAEQVDDETIDALGQIVTDVGELVDRKNEAVEMDETAETEPNDILERVHEFEAAHPRVSSFLAQITDLLAMMGI